MVRRLLALLFLILTPGIAWADNAASNWHDEDFASVRLISARNGVKDTKTLRLGLEFELQPHWKVYWRSAGDAGFPPTIDWSGSTNIKTDAITRLWPAPVRFSIFGLETFGYKQRVIFPIDVPLENPGQPVHLNTVVDYLACSDICVPAKASLSLDLPANTGTLSTHAHNIEKFAAKVPLTDGDPAGKNLPMRVHAVWQTGTGDKSELHVALEDVPAGSKPDILVEGPPRNTFGIPQATGQKFDDAPVYRLPIHGLAKDASLANQNLTLTVLADPLAIEQTLPVGDNREDALVADDTVSAAALADTSANETSSTSQSWWMIGLIALLGGLILNVMPCVLPVLSIKVMSAMKASTQKHQHIRSGFFATACGIVFSFWLIAGALILVKLAGGSIGWGIQFQQPLFLTAMTIIVAVFAFNMLGFFEIQAPSDLGDRANQAISQQTDAGRHLGGHFLTGMFATLLATPCSAPFLGTAVGFALAGSNFDIFWIFTLLGLGLAVPYIAIAIWPGVARLLPRPGRWMQAVKVVLALALIGTAIWLLSVLSSQIGIVGAIVMGIALALAGVALWRRRVLDDPRRKARFSAVAAFAVLVSLFVPGFTPPPTKMAQSSSTIASGETGPLNWQGFAPDDIAKQVAAGKTVLVDVTADWCVTCQVNKKLVLETDDVTRVLNANDVVLMKGDWTRPDPVIADFLARYDRYGIPFNAVYGPGAPDGILLSELLSKQEVIDAVRKAKGDAQATGNANGLAKS